MLKTLMWSAVLYFGVHWAYVIAMGAKAKLEAGTLTLYWKVMLAPAALIGGLMDFAFQFTFGWLMFLETPLRGGVFFSGRVQHHYRSSDGWRKRLAVFWARNLNVFDNEHIRA